MKNLIILFFITAMAMGCSNPDQNTATGNSVDSIHTSDSNATDANEHKSPGADNSGTNATTTFDDSTRTKVDSTKHK